MEVQPRSRSRRDGSTTGEMTQRPFMLRDRTACVACGTELAVGTWATWDDDTRTTLCLDCALDPAVTAPADAPASVGAPVAVAPTHGEAPPTPAFAASATGERLVGNRLDAMVDEGVVTLHDQRVPRTTASIDHVAVGPAGVFVIDTKRHRGRISQRDAGWVNRDERLYVAGRDRTRLAEGALRQADVVRAALGPDLADLPVTPVLCFANGEFPGAAQPFVVRGVVVTWPKALQALIAEPGPLDAATVDAAVRLLADRLRAA